LSKLNLLLRQRIFFDKVDKKVAFSLNKIDIDKEFRQCKEVTFFPIIDWIYREKYLYSAQKKIDEFLKKIKKQYNNSLRGGSNFNNHANGILSEMSKIELFLNSNFIIYNNFIEYKQLVNVFAEAMYASHAIVPNDNDKLSYFNPWILSLIYKHSSADHLISIFNLYKLKEIEFKESNEDTTNSINSQFIEVISEFKKRLKVFKIHFETNNDSFIRNQYNLIQNSLVISSQVKFGSKFIRDYAKLLGEFLKNYGTFSDIKYVEYFYHHKGYLISATTYRKTILSIIKNPQLHYRSLFEVITNIGSKNKIDLNLTDNQFNEILNFSKVLCTSCNQIHSSIYLCYVYRLIENKFQRQLIRETINNKLDDLFDFELFSFAVLYGVINLNNELLDLAISQSIPNKSKKGNDAHIEESKPNIRYHKIDLLINICFRESIDLNQKKFNTLKGISLYYDWLLDMDNFNYKEFNANWTSSYATKFYFKRMFECDKLKTHLESYIQSKDSHHDQQGMNDYINIYIRKTWNTN